MLCIVALSGKNMILKGIFELNREEATGGWRKLHSEEISNLCSSPNIIRLIK
jgi:hypothetical protein